MSASVQCGQPPGEDWIPSRCGDVGKLKNQHISEHVLSLTF